MLREESSRMNIEKICNELLASDPGVNDGAEYRSACRERDGACLHVRSGKIIGGTGSLWPPPHDASGETRAFYERAWDLANPDPDDDPDDETVGAEGAEVR